MKAEVRDVADLKGLDLIEYWAVLENDRRSFEDELKTIKAKQEEINERVLETFAESGVQSVRMHGLTVYLERRLWAGCEEDVTMDDACEALKEAGLEDLVGESYNTNTLSAYLRELERNEEEMPEQLVGKIKASEVFKVRARLSS